MGKKVLDAGFGVEADKGLGRGRFPLAQPGTIAHELFFELLCILGLDCPNAHATFSEGRDDGGHVDQPNEAQLPL